MIRGLRVTLAVLASVLGAACDREPPADVGPVPRVELDGADADVAKVILARVDEAERNPDDAGARGHLGLAYDANGMARVALVAFRQAGALDPREPRWTYHLARMQAATGDLSGALDSIARVLQRESGYVPAWLWQGEWLLDAGRADEAEESYRAAIRLRPEDPAGRIGLARVHLQRAEDREAIEILEYLLTRVADEPYIYHLIGIALRRTGDDDLAREANFRAANSTRLTWDDPWTDERERYRVGFAADLNRAIALASGERVEEGIAALEELRRDHPDNVALLSNLGAAYCTNGRFEEGIEALETAVRHRPGHLASLTNLSQAYEQTGRADEALRAAERTVEAHPRLGVAHVRKGQLLARAGREEEALESFETARRLDARSTVSLFWSGAVRCELNRWSEAVRDFQAVLEENPRLTGTHAWLARARAEAGDLPGARESLRQAMIATPRSPELDEIRGRIEQLERERDGGP